MNALCCYSFALILPPCPSLSNVQLWRDKRKRIGSQDGWESHKTRNRSSKQYVSVQTDTPYATPRCSKRLTGLEEPHSSGKAQQHRTTAAEPTFRCDRCGGTLFDSVTKLLRHVKVEHEDTFAKTKKLVGHSSGSSSATLRCPTVYIDSPVKRR